MQTVKDRLHVVHDADDYAAWVAQNSPTTAS